MADLTRELLDAYAHSWTDPDGECAHDCNDDRGCQAPKAFAALHAVLDVVDEMDQHDLFAAYAFRLRTTISTALEAP